MATILIRVLLACAYILMLLFASYDAATLLNFSPFALVGIFGAIIANSTGTGGGVVFVPIFSAIDSGQIMLGEAARAVGNISDSSVGMSFAIQSFGMTMGATVWIRTLFAEDAGISSDQKVDGSDALKIIFTSLSICIPCLLLTQWITDSPRYQFNTSSVLSIFKIFSLILGFILLTVVIKHDRFKVEVFRKQPGVVDTWGILVISAIGGVVTAFFSVGVGEFLAVYLIIRKYPTHLAVGAAVIVSAVIVVCGVWYHVATDGIIYEIVIWTAPGAIIGGLIAKRIAFWLGPQRLKTLAALWIIGSSLYLLLT